MRSGPKNQFDWDNALVKPQGTTTLLRCNFSSPPRRKSNCILIEDFLWHILVDQTVILIHCLADEYALWSASNKKEKNRSAIVSPELKALSIFFFSTTARWSKILIVFLSGAIYGTDRDYLSLSQNFDPCHMDFSPILSVSQCCSL